jgi:hypothetical protein
MKTFIKNFVVILSLHCLSIHAFADEVFVDFEDAALAARNKRRSGLIKWADLGQNYLLLFLPGDHWFD